MYIDADRTYSSIQMIPVFFILKGQIKPKADWRTVDSPKKQMNEFVLFALLLFTANKSNSFVRFLGESTARQSCFWFYLTFSVPVYWIWWKFDIQFCFSGQLESKEQWKKSVKRFPRRILNLDPLAAKLALQYRIKVKSFRTVGICWKKRPNWSQFMAMVVKKWRSQKNGEVCTLKNWTFSYRYSNTLCSLALLWKYVYTPAKTEIIYPKNVGLQWQWISHKINIRHPWQLKKSKSWEPFWSYQLNSTADLANLAHFWGKWAGLAVLFSW